MKAEEALKYLRAWDRDWRLSATGRSDYERKMGWNDQMALRRLHRQYFPRFYIEHF